MDDLLDYVCSVAQYRHIFYLWRPFLREADDGMVLELALGAKVDHIVAHNVRDFAGVECMGISIVTPGQFLAELKARP